MYSFCHFFKIYVTTETKNYKSGNKSKMLQIPLGQDFYSYKSSLEGPLKTSVFILSIKHKGSCLFSFGYLIKVSIMIRYVRGSQVVLISESFMSTLMFVFFTKD